MDSVMTCADTSRMVPQRLRSLRILWKAGVLHEATFDMCKLQEARHICVPLMTNRITCIIHEEPGFLSTGMGNDLVAQVDAVGATAKL